MDHTADLNLKSNFTYENGKSVSSGDINHDGYIDLIITAENYADYNFTDRILVFLGGSDPDSIADYILQTGSPSLEFRTNSLATVDFNHDGFDDILVGAPDNEEGKGKAYLFYGGDAINSSPDLEFAGENEDDNFGISVGSAGDLNNDGSDDILIGAAFNDFKGSAYIYFGGVEPDTIADVEIMGEDKISCFGYSVCSPGDMNSDGFPEIAVGSPDRLSNGMVYLFDFHTPKKGQELSFDSPEPVTYGQTPFALSASSNSGLPVEFSVSDNEVAVVSDNTVTIVGAGSVILTARQPGNSTYDAAAEITKSLEVYKANLEIRAKDTSKIEGSVNPEFTLLFSGFVNNDNAEDIDVLPAITTDATTGSAVGTYPIILTGGSDHNYNINCINGIITVKEITGVDSPKVGDELLFPNPAYGYVNIPFDYKNLEYTLYNMDGEIIMHHQLIDNQIDVSGLDSGCYFLRIGERMFKFIKN
jgi:hypothetical protein